MRLKEKCFGPYEARLYNADEYYCGWAWDADEAVMTVIRRRMVIANTPAVVRELARAIAAYHAASEAFLKDTP